RRARRVGIVCHRSHRDPGRGHGLPQRRLGGGACGAVFGSARPACGRAAGLERGAHDDQRCPAVRRMTARWSGLLLPLRYAWRNAWAHRGATAVTLFGVAISVMVYVVMGATADSLKGVAASTGDPANVIALSKGAGSAESSRLDQPTVDGVRFAPGVLRDASGEPMASVELLAMRRIAIAGRPPDDPASQRFMALRGVTRAALQLHPGVRIATGRFPAASGEILIGRLVTENLGAVAIGSEIAIEGRPHRVVG